MVATGGFFGRVNHSSPPTVIHKFEADVWTTTANVDLEPGHELCYDYNLGSKYEVRTDEFMLRFHEICGKHGVQKRPSLGMTAPPCTLPSDAVADAEPMVSNMPAQSDGATDCAVWC